MESGGVDRRPRVVLASVQGRDSLRPQDAAALERIAQITFHAGPDRMTPDEMVARFADAEVVALTPKVSPTLTADIIDRLPRLRAIALHATGFDFIDIDALDRRGILLCTLPDYSTQAVAEQSIGLMLMLSSRAHLGNDRSRGRVHAGTSLRGFELAGRTLGLVGCGRIGSRVAHLAQGIGMRTISYDIAPKPVPGVTYVDRAELYRRSHVVSLHCPLPFRGGAIVTAEQLALMPEGAVLINSSRCRLVDDEAVIDAIRRGHLRGYAVDDEHLGGDHVDDLLAEGRIVQTGHSAWWTDETLERGAEMWAAAILALATGTADDVLATGALLGGAVG
ncbi:MAG: NAD(P)-dependent oxidoreductase [Nitriliruptor sp.]